MNSISLIVTDQSGSGSYHVKMVVDEKESGILYLTPDQLAFISKSLWRSCTQDGVTFNAENPFDCEDSEDDEQRE
jgi:hypothetical protein